MNIDKLESFKKLDTNQVAESIAMLPEQIKQVLNDFKDVKLPARYKNVNKVVVAGMGGSNLGAWVIKYLFRSKLKVPVIVDAGYVVPKFVDKDTLYVMSSYSGNTEEPLSTYKEAKKRRAKIVAITSKSKKNKLANLIKKDKIPAFVFDPKNNPSTQPRLGLGYAIFGIMLLLEKAELFKVVNKDIKEVIALLEENNEKLFIDVNSKSNLAKKIANEVHQKQVVLVAAEFLRGNTRVIRNEFCESGKSFASFLDLPDMNHYALEGLSNPKNNKRDLKFWFFDSKLYHKRVQLRSKYTKQVIKKNKISYIDYELKGRTELIQIFEMLQLGTWVTYYLAIKNNVDPVNVPWVDWFKDQLKKS